MVWFMELLFHFSFTVCRNYGMALLFLSLLVTFITLPLFWIAENIQRKDREKKKAMSLALDKLEDVENRQEKYFYTLEVYKIHNYHPVQSLKGLLGLMIQIPFFIGAYRMLENYDALSGVSFGPVIDLFQPDRLYFGVNLLPFIMTAVNLIAGYFYTKEGEKSEKNQLLFIALLFLVLLYNKPSAMVLYWTMNNLLSIGKNALMGHKPALPKLRKINLFAHLNLAKAKDYVLTLMALGGLLFFIPAILLTESRVGMKAVFVILLELHLIALFASQFRKSILRDKDYFFLLSTVGFFLLHGLVVAVKPDLFSSYTSLMYLVLVQIPAYIILSLYVGIEPFRAGLNEHYTVHRKIYHRSAIGGIALFWGMVLLYSPISLYLTDITSLPFYLNTLILRHFIYFATAFFLSYGLYFLMQKRLRPIYSLIFAVLGMAGWIYTYLLPGNYGLLDVMIFTHPGRLNVLTQGFDKTEIILSLSELLILTSAVIMFIRWFVKNPAKVTMVLFILNLIALGQTAIPLAKAKGNVEQVDRSSAFLPDNKDDVFRLSRDKNTLVFMFDMFSGDLMEPLFEQYPHLKEDLTGFTWYPNTLTTGLVTYGSLPSILAGEDYTPRNVNAREISSMEEMFFEAYSNYFDLFKERGYQTTCVDPEYLNPSFLDSLDTTVAYSEQYMEYWLNNSEEAANLDLNMPPDAYARIFSVIGLFKATPHFVRPFIYMNGRWLMVSRGKMSAKHTVINLGFLDLMKDFLHVDDGPPAFKFINNQLTHNPWNINQDLKLDNTLKENRVRHPDYGIDVHENDSILYTAARTLEEIVMIMELLETEGVLDNTRIVIVSDHGYNGIHKQWEEMPVLRDSTGVPVQGGSRANCIFMVKDYGSREPFVIDDSLMSIADTPYFVTPQGTIDWEPESDRSVTVDFVPSHKDKSYKDSYAIGHQFTVSGDPSKAENWQYVTD